MIWNTICCSRSGVGPAVSARPRGCSSLFTAPASSERVKEQGVAAVVAMGGDRESRALGWGSSAREAQAPRERCLSRRILRRKGRWQCWHLKGRTPVWLSGGGYLHAEVDHEVAGTAEGLAALEEGAEQLELHFAGFVGLEDLDAALGVLRALLTIKSERATLTVMMGDTRRKRRLPSSGQRSGGYSSAQLSRRVKARK